MQAPEVEFTSVKGLDDDQIEEIKRRMWKELGELVEQRIENTDDSGIIYDMHERIRDILTEYNDTIRGRCAICLEDFCSKKDTDMHFSSRIDLVRVDECFHRFHLLCLHRDWFMPRVVEKDEFGCDVVYKMGKYKKCPTCRRKCTQQEIDFIHQQYLDHTEFEDRAY